MIFLCVREGKLNYLVLIRYSVDSKTIDRFIKRHSPIFNVVIVDNSPEFDLSCDIAGTIKGENHFREFSAIQKALNSIDTTGESKVFVCNDTIFTNRCSWKLDFLVRKLKAVNVNYPTIFGFLDESFEFLSDNWFLRNGFHIRTDIFALNLNGVNMFKEIMNNDFEKMVASDAQFNEISRDYMARYQQLKSGQLKEIAIFIELYISSVFFKEGFIYDARDSNFKLRQSFHRIIQRTLIP